MWTGVWIVEQMGGPVLSNFLVKFIVSQILEIQWQYIYRSNYFMIRSIRANCQIFSLLGSETSSKTLSRSYER